MYNAETISELVGKKLNVEIFDVIDSTNAYAKKKAADGEWDHTPVLIIAREQTSGRGRMGRSFLSREDRGIFMSLLCFTDKPLADAVSITTAAAAIVAREIEAACGNPMKIKWVNDIYNDRGKVCGILAETVFLENTLAIVIGIGINTGEDDFPPELRNIASSVGNIEGKEDVLISGIVRGLLDHLKHPDNREYMTEYRKRFMLEGEKVVLLSGGEEIGKGIVVGVDDDGGLVYIPEGTRDTVTLRSGEVSVRKKI